MGFSFKPFKAITRTLGLPDKYSQTAADLFPIVGGTQSHLAQKLFSSFGSKGAPPPSQPQIIHVPAQERQAPPLQYGQPQPYYGGGGGYPFGDQYSQLQPYTPFGGPAPWDYSTASSTYLVQPSQDYSMRGQDRTWEDLATLLPLFL